jgi:hypothetical protein
MAIVSSLRLSDRLPGGGRDEKSIGVAIQVEGLTDILNDLQRIEPNFNKEMRKAGKEVAQLLVNEAVKEAASVTRARQALEVMKGMRAQSDRLPTIKLSSSSGFVSKSRPNRGRKPAAKVTRGQVFFGAEFGGGARKATSQFLRHRGRSGYFFWPTVRKEKNNIARTYLQAMNDVMKRELFK